MNPNHDDLGRFCEGQGKSVNKKIIQSLMNKTAGKKIIKKPKKNYTITPRASVIKQVMNDYYSGKKPIGGKFYNPNPKPIK